MTARAKKEAPARTGAELKRMTCINYPARTEQARNNFVAELERAAAELADIIRELRAIQRGRCR